MLKCSIGETCSWATALLVALVALPSCTGKSGDKPSADAGASSSGFGAGGSSSDVGGSGPGPGSGGTVTQIPTPVTSLPPLPAMTNVVVTQREDSVGIDFDPVDGAADYRVYVLPTDEDILSNPDKSLTISNAVYRCAGLRQTLDLPNGKDNPLPTNDVPRPNGNAYFNTPFSWTAKVLDQPTLGFVYVTPGDGRSPVYAVGVHAADTELGWQESRPKIYTTDAKLRKTLVAAGGRDDGIVFYVPQAASSGTATVFHSETANGSNYAEFYFTSTDRAAHASDTTPPAAAFEVLTASASDTAPLMAVFYQAGQNHTELAVGQERYKRAVNQGPGPMWHLEWSGITEPTTLVVEALASGCPFQGFLSPKSLSMPPHQPLLTLAEIQSASKTGEVYINGEFDVPGTTFTTVCAKGTNGAMGGVWGTINSSLPLTQTPNSSPIPLARSFVKVAPQPHAASDWDWYEGFSVDETVPPFTPVADSLCQCTPTSDVPCNSGGSGCGYWTSPLLNVGTYDLDYSDSKALWAFGTFGGQLWEVFDDAGQDVGGEIRMTAPKNSTVSADTFLHVTFAVDIISTHRRYPQLIVSDYVGNNSIQDAMADKTATHNEVIVQTFANASPSPRYEMQAVHGLVNGKPWQVNNQGPAQGFIDDDTWNANAGANAVKQPTIPLLEHGGVDRMTKFDVYISSDKVYAFADNTPAGCVQMPKGDGFTLHGPVSVTFGDVLYHESATDEGICDQPRPYTYMYEHALSESKRHWDDLGFKAGVPAPEWDSARFPCLPFSGITH